METATQKKRKLIDIPIDQFRILSIAAINAHIPLKLYIEMLIQEKADSLRDSLKNGNLTV